MKRPFEEILDITSANLNRIVENSNRNFEFLQSFMVWLLGFTIGALSLVLSNFNVLVSMFNYTTIKTLIVLMSLSIIAGILNRLFMFLYQVDQNSNLFFLEQALSTKKVMAVEPDDLSEVQEVQTLLTRLNDDYGVNISFNYVHYQNSTDIEQQRVIKELKAVYLNQGQWAKKDFELGGQYVKELLSKSSGFTETEIEKAAELNPRRMRIYLIVFMWALIISCLSFMLAVIVLASAY